MNAALIVMTILGCNESGTDCHYIATANERWPSIASCDAVSEQHLPNYTNQPYPVLIAVCQNPETAGLTEASPPPADQQPKAATATEEPEQADSTKVTPEQAEGLAGRAIQRVRNVLPTTEGVKSMMVKPVRLVEDGYSWVARRFDR